MSKHCRQEISRSFVKAERQEICHKAITHTHRETKQHKIGDFA